MVEDDSGFHGTDGTKSSTLECKDEADRSATSKYILSMKTSL